MQIANYTEKKYTSVVKTTTKKWQENNNVAFINKKIYKYANTFLWYQSLILFFVCNSNLNYPELKDEM